MKKISKLILLSGVITLLIYGCKKGPGEGGNSSIRGYLEVIKMNQFLTDTMAIYGGADEDVYIIYGDDISYGDRIRSGPDGVFEFKFLRKGDYKVYVYSQDTLGFGLPDTVPNKFAVMKEANITEKKQIVDIDTMRIIKR
jgi:hypothetical protein